MDPSTILKNYPWNTKPFPMGLLPLEALVCVVLWIGTMSRKVTASES